PRLPPAAAAQVIPGVRDLRTLWSGLCHGPARARLAHARRPRGPKRGTQNMTSDSRLRVRVEDTVLPNGELLAGLRITRGWTQPDLVKATAQIARATNNPEQRVSLRTLQTIEGGGRRFQRVRLEGIAKALGVPVELIILHDGPAGLIEIELVLDRPQAEAE